MQLSQELVNNESVLLQTLGMIEINFKFFIFLVYFEQ